MKLFICLLLSLYASIARADLPKDFASPPSAARPWVYWFWNNGNVTKAGITADLEAMRRVGIGGVIIMDVVERFAPPPGTADFMGAEWQELFRFSVAEAHRLGLEINMTNGPGWCGSSGPWVTPELSMQRLVSTRVTVNGPAKNVAIPKPVTNPDRHVDVFDSKVNSADFYEDVAVLAYPADRAVSPEDVIDFSQKLKADGTLDWTVQPGVWIVERIGRASTGSSTRPPVKGGNGLEIDKLSAAAMDVHFDHLMGKLTKASGNMVGPTLSATHIDSWEVGAQNWTPTLRDEFKKRRGYDPLPYLPNVLPADGKPTVGDAATAGRFKWDYDQTISELLAENYVGRLATRAHEHGMRLSIEGYNLPFGDEFTYTARADEPMTEFWATGGDENARKGPQMASVAHVMGQKIVGAESFTAGDQEQWRMHPASVKALGDFQFTQGVNRFVVHRYAHQPYLDKFPGATMGPWGLHYERTNTWWEMSGAWHTYLARCQQLLRQGLFVADAVYLRPQVPNQRYLDATPALPTGYRYDEISAEALIERMTVKDGRLTLPDGMSYRLLVLSPNTQVTPALARKLKELISAGAAVYGPRPTGSPSLADFPKADAEVTAIGNAVWGDCDGEKVKDHAFAKGHVYLGMTLADVLQELLLLPDFTSTARLHWIHRNIDAPGDFDGMQAYFVASDAPTAIETTCTFRVANMRPELWNPETGEITAVAQYDPTDGDTTIPLRLEAGGSVFVVFRPDPAAPKSVAAFLHDGQPVAQMPTPPAIEIVSAHYGPAGDAARTRDVKTKLQTLIDTADNSFLIARLAEGDDPAFGVVKTLEIDYTVGGKPFHLAGRDTDTINLLAFLPVPQRAADLSYDASGKLTLLARQPGVYEVKSPRGEAQRVEVKAVPPAVAVAGPWEVRFPPKWGAPEKITLETLIDLGTSTDAGVRHFSGTMTYTTSFEFTPTPGTECTLDLGDVQVMAQIKLNGTDLGTAWNPPFRLPATALKAGRNTLEIRVADLWPNRLIADAALPPAQRLTWSSFEPFSPDSPLPKSGLIGPVKIESAVRVTVP